MNNRKINKRTISIIIIIIIVLAIIIAGISFFNYLEYKKTDEYKLTNIGYNKTEINSLEKELSDKNIKSLLEVKYNKNIVKIIKSKYYLKKNFNRYITYLNENKDKSVADIIAIVNTNNDYQHYENTKETNIEKGNLMLVNKYNYLTESYSIEDLENVPTTCSLEGQTLKEEANTWYKKMAYAASKKDFSLVIKTSTRTYEKQYNTYNNMKRSKGEDYADDVSARPGHSEHQTGLAIDVGNYGQFSIPFNETDCYKWLQENAYKYGFIERYPEGKEYLTGFTYEPWHYRYVGVDVATKIYNENITFDEYYAYYVEQE